MKAVKISLALAALGTLGTMLTGAAASAATTPPGNGAIQVFARPTSSDGSAGVITVTGVIGDYGTFVSIDKNGKVDPDGNFVKIKLHKGSFEVNSTQLNSKAQTAQPALNAATCSGFLSVTGPNTILDGTGLYKGIAGTATVTETFAFVNPRYTSGKHKGQCNTSQNAKAISIYGSVTALGVVTF